MDTKVSLWHLFFSTLVRVHLRLVFEKIFALSCCRFESRFKEMSQQIKLVKKKVFSNKLKLQTNIFLRLCIFMIICVDKYSRIAVGKVSLMLLFQTLKIVFIISLNKYFDQFLIGQMFSLIHMCILLEINNFFHHASNWNLNTT